MTRFRMLMAPAMVLMLAAAIVAVAQAQAPERTGRSFAGLGRSSLLGLVRMEQVQKELKLSEEQRTKVQAVVERITAESKEQSEALREIEDRDARRAKTAELSEQLDQKARDQLSDVLEREQMMRLYQIRMQVRPVVESLANSYVARRLELTDDQKTELAEINENMEAKQSELMAGMRSATQEQRQAASEKRRKIRSDADAKALALLTAQQKEAFEKMKGEKFELQMRRRKQ